MVIRATSARKETALPKASPAKEVVQTAQNSPSDSVELSGTFGPLGAGEYGYGKGFIGKLMQWTAREIPSRQEPMGEEEKQQIIEKLEPGDIVLTYASHRPNLGHLEYLTTGAHYTHCALYEGYGRIIETIGDQVTRSPLIDRLEGPVKVAIVRPDYKSSRDRGLVIREAKKLIGRPYDYKFDNNEEENLYCSELIEVAMKKVDPDLDVPDASFFGREITAPDAFKEMKGAKLIHDGGSNYWKNQLHQWPFYTGAAVGAGIGALVGGPLGGIIGAVAGFEGTLGVTKWLQKDSE